MCVNEPNFTLCVNSRYFFLCLHSLNVVFCEYGGCCHLLCCGIAELFLGMVVTTTITCGGFSPLGVLHLSSLVILPIVGLKHPSLLYKLRCTMYCALLQMHVMCGTICTVLVHKFVRIVPVMLPSSKPRLRHIVALCTNVPICDIFFLLWELKPACLTFMAATWRRDSEWCPAPLIRSLPLVTHVRCARWLKLFNFVMWLLLCPTEITSVVTGFTVCLRESPHVMHW